jgi:hypothetical protein
LYRFVAAISGAFFNACFIAGHPGYLGPLFNETDIPILRVVNLTGNLQVAAAVTMTRGGAQDMPDDVSPTSSFSLRGLPDVLQRHIASFCTPKTLTYMSRLAK